MAKGEKTFYQTIFAVGGLAAEHHELLEADYTSASEGPYVPGSDLGVYKRIDTARTIQLLKNAPLIVESSHTNDNTYLRLPCGLLITDDALQGRLFFVKNSSSTYDLNIQLYDGTSFYTVRPGHRVIIFHKENNQWEGAFNASDIDFDDSNIDIIAANVQEAIEALFDKVGISASPGFSFGKSGNISSGTWLLRPGQVPSNKAGVNVGLYNAELIQVSTGSEDLDTYTLEVYQHGGDSINLTLISTINVTNSRKEVVNITAGTTLTRNMHIAIKLSAGSAKNIGVDLQIIGSSTPQ